MELYLLEIEFVDKELIPDKIDLLVSKNEMHRTKGK